jgi:hypothetical protein
MTARAKWEIVGAVLALVVVCIIGGSWLGAREDRIRMQATLDAQKTVIETAAKQSKDLQSAEAERDKATAASVATLQATAAKQVTPAEIVAWLPRQAPVPQPITFQIPAATAQNPSPDATASIPQSDLPALRDDVAQCQTCFLKLTAAQADLSSRDERLKLAGEQLSAVQNERDAAIKAAKGGGFWSRVHRSSKWLVIGGALAGGAICGTGHCK